MCLFLSHHVLQHTQYNGICCGHWHSLKMRGIKSTRPIPTLTLRPAQLPAATDPSKHKQRPPSSVAGTHGRSDYFRQQRHGHDHGDTADLNWDGL